MSMPVIFIKVDSSLHQQIVESKGLVLTDMGKGRPVEGYTSASDMFDELDYRDISHWVDDESHPFHHLFSGGTTLVDGYDWTSGPPGYFSPDQARDFLQLLNDHEPEVADVLDDEENAPWQFTSVLDFFKLAVLEGRGVIVGVD